MPPQAEPHETTMVSDYSEPVSVFPSLPFHIGNVKIRQEDARFQISRLQQGMSASAGALLTALFMTPLDVVKTRLQSQHVGALADGRTRLLLHGTWSSMYKIAGAEGITALWSGLGFCLIAALPQTVVYFIIYEHLKIRLVDYYNLLKFDDGKAQLEKPMYLHMLAGVIARVSAVTVVSPIELIRTKMQSENMSYSHIAHATRDMVAKEGVLTLYRGLPPTVMRDVPFSGIYWTTYELVKRHYGVTEPNFAFSFLAGAIAGALAATITTPFDVIKTHEQVEFGERNVPEKQAGTLLTKRRVKERLLSVYRQNGWGGLFAGLGPRLLKISPASAVMLGTFELGKAYFYNLNARNYQEKNI